MSHFDTGLMWFRRDLRASDNAALHHALRHCRQLWCVFVFDRDILDPLPRADRRVEFIRESLVALEARLRELGDEHGRPGTGLIVLHDQASRAIPALAKRLGVQAVFANHDDEPAALARDAQVLGALAHQGVLLRTHKDHVIFERREVLTQSERAFGVFTPYKNAWLKALTPFHLKAYPIAKHAGALAPLPEGLSRPVPTLAEIGFQRTNLSQLALPTGEDGAHQLFDDFLQRIDRYDEARDYPAVKGPSYLSAHLRFGTVSVRALASIAHGLHAQGNPGATPGCPNSSGATSTTRSWPTFRTWRSAPSSPPTTPCATSTARPRTPCSRPGARAAPATRWWTRPWRRSCRPATCTTACAWWWPASW